MWQSIHLDRKHPHCAHPCLQTFVLTVAPAWNGHLNASGQYESSPAPAPASRGLSLHTRYSLSLPRVLGVPEIQPHALFRTRLLFYLFLVYDVWAEALCFPEPRFPDLRKTTTLLRRTSGDPVSKGAGAGGRDHPLAKPGWQPVAHTHLAGWKTVLISSARCLRRMCFPLGMPRAVAMASALNVGSSISTAPWTPLLVRLSAYS